MASDIIASNLSNELSRYEALRQYLRAEFPRADEEAIQDTLEGLSSLPEMIAAVLRSHLDDVAIASGLKSRLAQMEERLKRIEARAEKKRTLVLSVMERAEIKQISEPDFALSLRSTPPALIVTAEADIPETYWVAQPMKLDRRGLIAALNRGATVPGARLGNGGMTISVRTR